MSERLEELVQDLSSNKLELAEFINDYYLMKERVEELEEWREQYHERNMVLLKENKRYKQALEEVLITDEFEDPQDYIDRIVTKASEALEQEK